MNHPNAIELEAFASGENAAAVEKHLRTCEACRAFVQRARTLRPRVDGARAVRAAQRIERRRRIARLLSMAAPVALAAAAAVSLRVGRTPDVLAPAPLSPSGSVTASEPETTFKGAIQLAVVREREAAQQRFTGAVRVRSGDRLRLEVAIDRPQAILGAVIGDDGSYVELMTEGVREAGTYLSEKTARIDPRPSGGTILVGPPELVRHARATGDTRGVTTLRVEWEQAPQ